MSPQGFNVFKNPIHYNIGKFIRERIDAECYFRLFNSKVLIVRALIDIAWMVWFFVLWTSWTRLMASMRFTKRGIILTFTLELDVDLGYLLRCLPILTFWRQSKDIRFNLFFLESIIRVQEKLYDLCILCKMRTLFTLFL